MQQWRFGKFVEKWNRQTKQVFFEGGQTSVDRGSKPAGSVPRILKDKFPALRRDLQLELPAIGIILRAQHESAVFQLSEYARKGLRLYAFMKSQGFGGIASAPIQLAENAVFRRAESHHPGLQSQPSIQASQTPAQARRCLQGLLAHMDIVRYNVLIVTASQPSLGISPP